MPRKLLIIFTFALLGGGHLFAAGPDRKAAVAPLVDFANWCARSGAKTAGVAALEQAKNMDPDDTDLATPAGSLAEATDENAATPVVVARKQTAYESAAKALEKLAQQPHAPADDASYDQCLLQAVRLVPHGRVNHLLPLIKKAVADKQTDRWQELYAASLGGVDEKELPNPPAALEDAMRTADLLVPSVNKIVKETIDSDGVDRFLFAGRLLAHVALADSKEMEAGKYQAALDPLKQDIFILTTPTHPMVAYVSLPKEWNPVKQWPVLVGCADAARDYEFTCRSYRAAVGDGPWIVICPITFGNTNDVAVDQFKSFYPLQIIRPMVAPNINSININLRNRFDLPGIVAIVHTVQQTFHGEDQIYVSGFSGGGVPCYGTMLNHPELVAAGATACANFFGATTKGHASGQPVQQYFGGADPGNNVFGGGPGFLQEGGKAGAVLTQAGYTVAPKIVVPNAAHDGMYDRIVAYFNSVRGDNK